MEVTALCVTVLINVSLVLIEHIHCSYSQRAVVGFPLVVPNTQQLFEYEPITVSCEGLEGLTGWRVMKKIMGVNTICASTWEDSTRPCSIKTAFSADSGEYWCEAGGRRTNVVNITVTGGTVILESPAVPVTEGQNLTLRCRRKTTSFNLTADFYKDSIHMKTGYEGQLIIPSVSKSDEGLYKCSISGSGESAESRLTVRVSSPDEPDKHRSARGFLLLWIIGTVLLMTLMFLLLGLLHYQRLKVKTSSSRSSFHPSSPPQPVSVQGSVSTQYTAITKEKDKEESQTTACYYTLNLGISSHSVTPAVNPPLTEEDPLYYSIE